MFAINDALAHEIIRVSHDPNPDHVARFHTTVHPTAMRPAVMRGLPASIAPLTMVRQAAARMMALASPARPAEAACCPAAIA